nr:olfactory receptor 8 [Tropidothorax elegans]
MGPTDRQRLLYDFKNERMLWMCAGGFEFVRRPIVLRLLNFLYVAANGALYAFFGVTCFATVIRYSDDKDTAISAFFFLWVLLLIFGLFLLRHTGERSLSEGLDQLSTPVLQYEDRERQDIVKGRIVQIRRLVLVYSVLSFAGAAVNTLFAPMQNFDTATEDQSGNLNPYLPLPIDIGFDTRGSAEYISIYVLETFFMFIILVMYTCYLEIFVAVTLQTCAHIESLNHSIRSISNTGDQRSMYLALRQCIIIHQAVIKVHEKFLPYMESTNCLVIFSYSLILAFESIIYLKDPIENLPALSFLLNDLLNILFINYLGQMVEDKSEETYESLYSTPWPECGREFRTLLSVALLRARTPLAMKTRFFSVKTGLKTFSDIVSWGYKMVNLLR